MKILLINPIVRPESPPAYFPLGLASVAGTLISKGYDVEALDINAYRLPPLEVQQFLKNARFDWLGITGLITEYNQVKWLSAAAKQYHPDKPVVLGGGLASSVPDLILENTAVDIVVIGEGEQTAADLSQAIENNLPLESVRGIGFRRKGQIYYTEKQPFIADLDNLPPTVWHLFPVNIYAKGEKLGFEFPVQAINILSGRGCPYHCSYCFHGIFGHKYRARSPRKVVEEILYLKNKYHLKGVLFSDDTLTLNRNWVTDFCKLIQEHCPDIRWACNGRVNLMDPELLKLMKQSGCCSIFYGIESGSQKILDSINKGVTVEQAAKVIHWSRKAGLDAQGYFIIGAPGETRETVRETIEFCQQNNLGLGLSIASPLPGTKWFELAVSAGKITDIQKLIPQWGRWNNGVMVNLSLLSDDELMALKHDAEQITNTSILKKKTLISEFQRWNNFKNQYGLHMFVLKAAYKLLRTSGLTEPYTKNQCQIKESSQLWANVMTNRENSI